MLVLSSAYGWRPSLPDWRSDSFAFIEYYFQLSKGHFRCPLRLRENKISSSNDPELMG